MTIDTEIPDVSPEDRKETSGIAKAKNKLSQTKRRAKERAWLQAHGYTSWEQIHTAIMKGELLLLRPTQDFMKDKEQRFTREIGRTPFE